MRTMLSLRLVTAALLAASPFHLLAADATTPPTVKSRAPAKRPGETAEQRIARHDLELNEAKPKLDALEQGLPLLTALGWEAKEKTFRTELAKLEGDLAVTAPKRPQTVKPEAGKPFIPKTVAQLRAERRDADFALMRRQADTVLESRPELRDYVEQRFQWHLRLFGVLGKYHDNPKVLELVQRRLQGPPEVQPDK